MDRGCWGRLWLKKAEEGQRGRELGRRVEEGQREGEGREGRTYALDAERGHELAIRLDVRLSFCFVIGHGGRRR
jgi:hypothetical protein